MSSKRSNEDRLEKIRQSLKNSNGQVDEFLKQEIQSFISDKKQSKINSLLIGGPCSDQEGLTNKEAEQATKPCNDPNENLLKAKQPEPIKLLVRETIISLLNPLKTTFITEVAKYQDAISIEEKKTKKIKRAINANTIKILQNGQFKDSGNSGWIVNPEFKQLLATGYKPKDDSEAYQKYINNPTNNNLKNAVIGTPESDYIKKLDGTTNIDGIETKEETITTTVNNVGGALIKAYEDLTSSVAFNNTEAYQEISLKGYSTEAIEAKKLKFNPSISTNPNWTISYKEAGEKYYLNIVNNFEYFTNNKITKDTSSYYFEGSLASSLTNTALEELQRLSGEGCETQDNKELASTLMMSNANSDVFNINQNIVDRNTGNIIRLVVGAANSGSYEVDLKQSLNNVLKQKYPHILSQVVSSFFSSYKNNRLLKDFKQTIPGLGQQSSNLKIVNLLNFIPQPSEEMLQCGKQPHPLNLDLVVDLMVEKFNSATVQANTREQICDLDKKNPLAQASEIAITLMFLRICIFENILKGLFVLDEEEYSFDLLNSELLSNFIEIKTIEELKKFNFLEDMENIVEENYDFFKEKLNITEEDEQNNLNIDKIFVNKTKFENSSEQMKSLIKHLIRRNFGFLKNLIGTSEQQNNSNSNFIEKVVLENKIYDIPRDQTIIADTKYLETFERMFPTSGSFFTLERFIDFEGDQYPVNNFNQLNSNQRSSVFGGQSEGYVLNNTNLNIYEDFLIKFLDERSRFPLLPNNTNPDLDLAKMNTYLKPPKICLRLVQNFYKKTLSTPSGNSRPDISGELYKFIGFDEGNVVKSSAVKNKKMYSFYNVNKQTNEYHFYNSLLVSEVKIPLSFEDITQTSQNNSGNREVKNLSDYFNTRKQELLDLMMAEPKVEIILKKCFFADKLPNLALFYSHSALSNSLMNNMFNTSKKRIYNLHDVSINASNYLYKNETDLKGGIAKKFQNDFQNIGDPTGGTNPDILQFLITTPILILKGLAQVIDPNIAIASQIVNAAAAGLLFPKLNEQGEPIGYPGDKIILPTALASLALLPVNIFAPLIGPAAIGPPVTPLPGMLYWALEPLLWKLPFYQNQAANSEEAKRLKNDPNNKGLKIGEPSNFNCSKDQDEP